MSEVLLSRRLTPNSQMMPEPPSSLQGKDASREEGREKVAPEVLGLQVPKWYNSLPFLTPGSPSRPFPPQGGHEEVPMLADDTGRLHS